MRIYELRDLLIGCDGARAYTGSRVRDVEEAQKPLDDPVFAALAVEGEERDVPRLIDDTAIEVPSGDVQQLDGPKPGIEARLCGVLPR